MKLLILFISGILLIACCEKKLARINYSYFECEECNEGELDSLLKSGVAIIPQIGSFLLKGPPKPKLDSLIAHLDKTYSELVDFEKEFPENKVAITREEYIDTFSENYKNQYRLRAIIVLKKLNSAESNNIIKEALVFGRENKWNNTLINEMTYQK